jgi:hypothetical protein
VCPEIQADLFSKDEALARELAAALNVSHVNRPASLPDVSNDEA